MSKDEIREILEEQLLLVSEASKREYEAQDLAGLTNSMLSTAAMILAFE
jgi:hypothetical protein